MYKIVVWYWVKGTVSRDFRPLIFTYSFFPKALILGLKVFEKISNSWRYSITKLFSAENFFINPQIFFWSFTISLPKFVTLKIFQSYPISFLTNMYISKNISWLFVSTLIIIGKKIFRKKIFKFFGLILDDSKNLLKLSNLIHPKNNWRLIKNFQIDIAWLRKFFGVILDNSKFFVVLLYHPEQLRNRISLRIRIYFETIIALETGPLDMKK